VNQLAVGGWVDVVFVLPGGSPGTIETITCNYLAAGS